MKFQANLSYVVRPYSITVVLNRVIRSLGLSFPTYSPSLGLAGKLSDWVGEGGLQ